MNLLLLPGMDGTGLLLQATRDRLVPARCASEMATIAPNLKIIRIPGPHMLLQANPAKCWEQIHAFIR